MMQRLNLNSTGDDGEIRSLFKNAYERIAGSDDYARNQRSLRMIQVCVITISACATGFVNAFAHRERLGWVGASLLAILITGFVEKFYFALRHGLATIYKSRRQRFFANFCCKIIQFTMILNAGILCAWVVGSALPEFLQTYNKWTIAIHFSLALIGVSAVRDSDAVVEDRIRKLKAESVQEDILTTRRAAINDNPLVFTAARIRGFLDGVSLAVNLLRDKPDFCAKDAGQILDIPQRLRLPDGNDDDTQPNKVTDISGKLWRR